VVNDCMVFPRKHVKITSIVLISCGITVFCKSVALCVDSACVKSSWKAKKSACLLSTFFCDFLFRCALSYNRHAVHCLTTDMPEGRFESSC